MVKNICTMRMNIWKIGVIPPETLAWFRFWYERYDSNGIRTFGLCKFTWKVESDGLDNVLTEMSVYI